ncbi:CAP domain-containing protein [Deinococcus altitudinis]|uniref:CAP domain-containing protein n=1 Tax=Deinococcus altitudinis TaxID=468914 RepID=UPI003891D9B0
MKVQQWSGLIGVLALALTACGGSSTPTAVTSTSVGSGTNASVPAAPVTSQAISADEQTILDAVNVARASARTCGTTAFAATTPLTWNAQLAAAARVHSEDMAQNGYRGTAADAEAAHVGTDGSTPQQRITQAGYVWKTSGENVAAGYTVGGAFDVVTGWLNSPGHCANIMSPKYKEIGVSFVFNDKMKYNSFFTQDFGSR